jgi:hypothetical protein
MKKEIKKLQLRNNRESDIPMFFNYSHFKFISSGIILTSNKGLNLPKVFIRYEDVAYILYF